MTTQKRILARNISSTFFVQIANYVFPMISVPIIVRIIGPEKFGLISYSGAIITYFTLLINYSFNFTSARQVAQSKSDWTVINQIFNDVFGTKVFLFGVSSLLFALCFVIFPVFRENHVLFLSTFLVCAAWTITPDWFYQGMGELHRTAIFNLITKVVFTVLILSMIRKPADYYWQPLSFSIAQFVVAAFSWRWVVKKYKLKPSVPALNKIFTVLHRDRLVFFSSVVISLYTSTNILVLAAMVNTLEVGYFSAAQKFILISQAVITIPLAQSVFPMVSHAFGEGKENGIETVRKIAPYVAITTFLAGIGMIVVGPWLIEIYYGDAFNQSKGIFRVMAFIPFVISISNLYGIQVMLNMHMDKVFLRIVMTGAVFSLILNAFLARTWSGMGSSISWLVTEIFIALCMGIYLSRLQIKIFSFRRLVLALSLKQLYNIIPRSNR